MKSTWLLLLLVLLILFPNNLFCQTRVKITEPRLELSNENLIIEFDILSAAPSDVFKVWIEVTNASGLIINAQSLSGDIGEEITGGNNKRILWNLELDAIALDNEIFIEVVAEKMTPPESTPPKYLKTVSKGNMILSSIVLPGWGLSKIRQGKPYWLLGVAGYGCIAGSVYLNRTAINTYDEYRASMDIEDSNALYDKAIRQNTISKSLGYSAAGIWAISIIWSLVTTVPSPELSIHQSLHKISIQPLYNQHMNCTMISLNYVF